MYAIRSYYGPEADVLRAIRQEIYESPDNFKEVLYDEDFKQYFTEIMGEKLKTVPKGFDKEFADIDLLRYKSYAFGNSVSDEKVLGEDFVEDAIDMFRQLSHMNRFLNDAIRKRKSYNFV